LRSRFPTRQYPYRELASGTTFDQPSEPLAGLQTGTVVRFFLGKDDDPTILTPEDITRDLNDPFGRLVLQAGHRPQTLLEVLSVLDAAADADRLAGQRIYRVADGGQIPWTPETARLDRHLRLVVTRHRGEEAELFISTTAPFASDGVFLQIFAWDPKSGAYNFYERRRGIWSWAGSSWEAQAAPTRGQGPFDSHVNGCPVMKELKAPWMHWHSEASQIRDDIFPPDDPLRTDTFYQGPDLKGGEDLERIVRSGITRWTESRFDRLSSNGRLIEAPQFFRQILTTTTINITSSQQQSSSLIEGDSLRLPTTFFLNSDCLISELALPVALTRQKVSASFYLSSLDKFGVRLKDGDTTLDQDTYFAFPVPEPSFEDEMVLRLLLARGAISRRLAITLLAVDFPNPIFSERRESLMPYIPSSCALDGGSELEQTMVAAARQSPNASDPNSPEAEFLALWEQPADTWESDLSDRIQRYWKLVEARMATLEGFEDIFRLSESRRRQFRKRRLSEFGLTLPCAAKISLDSPLRMTERAQIEPLAGQT